MKLPTENSELKRLENLASQMAALGVPTTTYRDSDDWRHAAEILEQTGRMEVALERLSEPLMSGGYRNSDLLRSLVYVLALLFIASTLMVFASEALLPTYQTFYDETDLVYSTGLKTMIWVRDRVLPMLSLVQLAVLLIVVWLYSLDRLKMPWFVPGRRAYHRATQQINHARVLNLREPSAFWRGVESHGRCEAISIAAGLRRGLPIFFGVVVGGTLVAAYAYVLFLPLVHMLRDLTDASLVQGRRW